MQRLEIPNQIPAPPPEPGGRYRRPAERPLTAAERGQVTVLIGGLTWKHETLIEAVFTAAGYRCRRLPTARRANHETGKRYGSRGLCNPAYFTCGALIDFLQELEAGGLRRSEILERYLYFTAGSCGPCRFGMYEAEYVHALANAGFAGFRVLVFRLGDGLATTAAHTGMEFTPGLLCSGVDALMLGDLLSAVQYRLRPYERQAGAADALTARAAEQFAQMLAERACGGGMISLARSLIAHDRRRALKALRQQIGALRMDRLRVKPVVKITGEFWAQLTEGDGNFRMLDFLEQQGAQALVEPVSTWTAYLLRLEAALRWRRNRIRRRTGVAGWLLAWAVTLRDGVTLAAAQGLWRWSYGRVQRQAGAVTPGLASQRRLARLAARYFPELVQGGEGYMEIAKTVEAAESRNCHMVLGLKPFGCMPSTQSDAVQSSVARDYPDLLYLAVETAGEGAVHAYSRVQMALAEAQERAHAEFEQALRRTGRTLAQLQAYVAAHPELESPLYRFARERGVASEAAQFALHLHQRMRRDAGGRA